MVQVITPRRNYSNRQLGSSLSYYAILPPDGQSGIAAEAHTCKSMIVCKFMANKNYHLFGVNGPTGKKWKIRLKNRLVGHTLKVLQYHVNLDLILFS